VSQLERRLLEAYRLGFKRAIIPAAAELRDPELKAMELLRAETIADAIDLCFTPS
jgi:predicted ATP-dependent serine protease